METDEKPIVSFQRTDTENLYHDLTHDQEFDRRHMQTFIDSLEQTPRNLDPFYAFEYMYQYEHEDELARHLAADSSGLGANNDAEHVQKMVFKSLEQHPKLLEIYMNGKVRN